MVKRLFVVMVLSTSLAFSVGCHKSANNSKLTPQYKAAVSVDDVAQSLSSLQNLEINIYKQGQISPENHIIVQTNIKKAFQLNDQARAAVLAGDLAGGHVMMNSALALLQSLDPNMINIKSAESQTNFRSAVALAETAIQAYLVSIGGN